MTTTTRRIGRIALVRVAVSAATGVASAGPASAAVVEAQARDGESARAAGDGVAARDAQAALRSKAA